RLRALPCHCHRRGLASLRPLRSMLVVEEGPSVFVEGAVPLQAEPLADRRRRDDAAGDAELGGGKADDRLDRGALCRDLITPRLADAAHDGDGVGLQPLELNEHTLT